MPQFDTSTYVSQAFWVLTVFFCFWLIMDKLIIPQIAETIETRKRKYNDLIQKAEEINQKAQVSLHQYEDMLTAARLEANEQIAQNEKELMMLISKKEEGIKKELEQKMAEQEAKLASEREKIIKQADKLSSNLALMVIQKLNLPTITQADIDDAAQKGDLS